MAAEIRRVGLIGFGYWGQKLARVLNDKGVLVGIADSRDGARENVYRYFAQGSAPVPPRCYSDFGVMLESLAADAVAIATPPETHYEIARFALETGLHVFVEKPMTTRAGEAREMEAMAAGKGLRLKTGHIYLHCPGLTMMPRPLCRRELYVSLLNPAAAPSETTRELKWAGLPHAASIACWFFPDDPLTIETSEAASWLRAQMTFWDGSRAFITVADHTGVRARMVDMVANGVHHQFDADHPHGYCIVGPPGVNWTTSDSPKEPLTAELEDFLGNDRPPYPRGSRVVALTERIVEACRR